MSTATSPAPLVTFKKPPRRPQASRKRSISPFISSSTQPVAGPSTDTVIRPTKKSLVNPLIQGTKRRRDPTEGDEGVGVGLEEMDYRADEGLIGGKGDVYATRAADYDLDGGEGERKGLGEKKVRLNEVGHSLESSFELR